MRTTGICFGVLFPLDLLQLLHFTPHPIHGLLHSIFRPFCTSSLFLLCLFQFPSPFLVFLFQLFQEARWQAFPPLFTVGIFFGLFFVMIAEFLAKAAARLLRRCVGSHLSGCSDEKFK